MSTNYITTYLDEGLDADLPASPSGTPSTGTVCFYYATDTLILYKWNGSSWDKLVPVLAGGTGLATLTAHAVMLGEGTSNVGFATVGTANRVLADNGASADPSFKTISALLDAAFDNTEGDILVRGASVWEDLPAGASGYVLTSNGAASVPSWQAAGGGGSPGGSSNDVQYNNSGSFGGITLADGKILVGQTSAAPLAKSISGDATMADTGALTFATVNTNVGSYTSANITVNAKGLITAAANGSSGGTLELTDGTHDLTSVTKITVTNMTVGGTSAAATLTPTGFGSSSYPYNASQYTPQAGGNPVPALSSFTKISADAAGPNPTISTIENPGIAIARTLIVGTQTVEQQQFIGLSMAAPGSTPYLVAANIAFTGPLNKFWGFPAFGWSDGTKFQFLTSTSGGSGATPQWARTQLSANGTQASSTNANLNVGTNVPGRMWVGMKNDGTNLHFMIGQDGLTWFDVMVNSITDYLSAATNIVLGIYNNNDAGTVSSSVGDASFTLYAYDTGGLSRTSANLLPS